VLKKIAFTFLLFIMAMTSVIAQAEAQSWSEQQKMYNEKANAEAELFHQREELERLRQDAKQREGAEHERAIRELQQRNKHLQHQRERNGLSPEIGQTEPDREWAYDENSEYQRLKDANDKEALASIVRINEKYYSDLIKKLVLGENAPQIKFTLKQAQAIAEAHKDNIYRTARMAQAGDAEAQYNLALLCMSGQGVVIDDAKAEALLKTAKDSGYSKAEILYEKILKAKGKGVSAE
jgi:hypothetical protein